MEFEGKLSDYAEVVMGQSPSGENVSAQIVGPPLLNGPTEFGPSHPRPVQWTRDPKKFAKSGNILFCVRGSTTGRMNWADQTYAIGRGLAAIRGKNGFDIRFIRGVIETGLPDLLALATGSTFPNVGRDDLLAIPAPMISCEGSIAIGSVLKAINDRIDHNRALAANLEAIARRLFKSWFVDFDPVRAKAAGEKPTSLADDIAVLFPDRFVDSEIGEVPEGWGYRSLAAVASLNPDAWTTRKHPDSVNYIDLSNVKNGLIEIATKYMWESAPSRARRVLRIGDTIVGTVRPGNCSFAFVDHDGLTGSTGFAVLRPTRKTYREFLYFAATSDDAIDRLAHFADGAAYPAVRSDVVLATEIAIPSDAVMNKFSEVTRRVIDRASVCKREAVVLAHIRDILLPRLISGEIRVSDAHKQIEEALG